MLTADVMDEENGKLPMKQRKLCSDRQTDLKFKPFDS